VLGKENWTKQTGVTLKKNDAFPRFSSSELAGTEMFSFDSWRIGVDNLLLECTRWAAPQLHCFEFFSPNLFQ
jgi:hypothetical protein